MLIVLVMYVFCVPVCCVACAMCAFCLRAGAFVQQRQAELRDDMTEQASQSSQQPSGMDLAMATNTGCVYLCGGEFRCALRVARCRRRARALVSPFV